jgi:hypothetical protein
MVQPLYASCASRHERTCDVCLFRSGYDALVACDAHLSCRDPQLHVMLPDRFFRHAEGSLHGVNNDLGVCQRQRGQDTSAPSSPLAVDHLVPESTDMQISRPPTWDRSVMAQLITRPTGSLAAAVQVLSTRRPGQHQHEEEFGCCHSCAAASDVAI